MTVADELTRSENGWGELGAIDNHVEALFEQADQILAGIAFHRCSFFISAAELLFRHIAIIALELLLGAQLNAEVGQFAFAALTVLAWAVVTTIDGRFGTALDILAHTAIELIFGTGTFGHINDS